MWLWTVLILVFYESFAQPITNKGDNVRESRQLDIGECCPCPGFGNDDARRVDEDQASATSNGADIFGSASEADDCPCKFQQNDQVGASSIFFPAAMRVARPFLRPTEKKEDLKPLLHPEVDLASSVLETLREATNEEYHEALARDALRDAVKFAELSVPAFNGATPEENRNIVTLLVNPKQNEDDVIPLPSHIQESRCIHAPLGSARENLDKLIMTPEHPNLLNDILNLPTPRPFPLLHKKIIDNDNNIAASDVQEHIMHFDKGQRGANSRNVGFRPLVPLLKLKPIIKSTSMSSLYDGGSDDCNPDLKPYLIQNIGSEMGGNTVPKINFDNFLQEKTKNKEDNNYFAVDPNSLEERASEIANSPVKQVPNFRKITIDDVLKSTRAAKLKNLFKLKDVELIPFGALNKPIVKPTRLSIHSKNDYENSIFRNKDCSSDVIKNKPVQISTEPETFDSMPNPSNTILKFDNTPESTDDEKYLSKTINDGKSTLDFDNLTNEDNDFDTQKSCEREIETATSPNANDIYNDHYSTNTHNGNDCKTDDKQRLKNINDLSVANLIENPNDVLSELTEDNMVQQQSYYDQNKEVAQDSDLATSTTKLTLSKPLPLENQITSIAQKIKSRLGNLKTVNSDLTSLFNQSTSDEETITSSASDCNNEMTEQVDTTLKPIKLNEVVTSVIMQDLQKISNSLLQKEEELNTNKTTEYNDYKSSTEDIQYEMNTKSRDLSNMDDIRLDQEGELSPKKMNHASSVCSTDPTLSKNFSSQKTDNDLSDRDNINQLERSSDSSNIVISNLAQNTISPVNEKIKAIPSQNRPSSNMLKKSPPDLKNNANLDTLPVLGGNRFNVFDNTKTHTTENLPSQDEQKFCTPSVDVKSDMATDASTINSRLKYPTVGLLGNENIDPDIFQLIPSKPGSQHAYNTGIQNDLTLKPIQFKSQLRNNFDNLGSRLTDVTKNIHASDINTLENSLTRTVSEVLSNVAESFPNVKDFKNQMRSHTQELLNTPSFFENIDDILDLSDIKYHAENSIKNIGQKLKSATNDLNFRSPTKKSNPLLDAISNSQNDIHEKLRAVHIDLNDRLESLRSSGIGTKYLQMNENNREGNGIRPPNIKSFKDLINKDRQTFMNSINEQEPTRKDSLLGLERKFKIAHTPVPKTVEIPKLKSLPPKTTMPNLKDTIFFKSIIGNTESPQFKQSMKDLQNDNRNILGSQNNYSKKNSLKVSISTTPRPLFTLKPKVVSTGSSATPIHRLKANTRDGSPYKNSEKQSAFQLKDSKESLSETKPLSILAPQTKELISHPSSNSDRDNDVTYGVTEPLLSNINKPLKSWPKVIDSAFMDKVKEAMQARLPKTISVKRIENKDISSGLPESSVHNKNDSDMSRSASENLEIVNNDETLKENVSYRCRMVCTKE